MNASAVRQTARMKPEKGEKSGLATLKSIKTVTAVSMSRDLLTQRASLRRF